MPGEDVIVFLLNFLVGIVSVSSRTEVSLTGLYCILLFGARFRASMVDQLIRGNQLFAKRLKSISCHRRCEELTAQVDILCEKSGAGDQSTYYTCMELYTHAIRAADRYCVIVTTDTVFVFATAVVLVIMGWLTYKRIGKVQAVAR